MTLVNFFLVLEVLLLCVQILLFAFYLLTEKFWRLPFYKWMDSYIVYAWIPMMFCSIGILVGAIFHA